MNNKKNINTPTKDTTAVTQPHDKGYKRDLKKPSEFLHFLQKYVGADWTKDLTTSQLTLLDKEFISRDYDGKEADIIYSISHTNKNKIFVFVLQELQSSVDHTMIFRVLVYIMNVLTDFFMNTDTNERERADFKLPAIIPIIFYNGEEKWTAAQSLKDYLYSAELFGEYTLNLKYYLVDLNEINEEYILNSNTIIDNIMYCDKFRQKSELLMVLNNAFRRVNQLGQQDKEDFLNWSENILLSICGNNKENVRQYLEAIRNGGGDMAFEYNIVRVFREDKEKTYNEGKRASKVESIIELLSDYGIVPEELKNRLNSENNFDILKKWHKLSARVNSVQEFIDKM